MSVSHTRTDQALLAAAGFCVPDDLHCDLRLERISEREWRITVLSGLARDWLQREFCTPLRQAIGDELVVDIWVADRFLKAAHDQGIRTEFVGQSGKDVV